MQHNEGASKPDDYAQERGGQLWSNKGTVKHRKFLTAADLMSIIHCEIVQHMSRRDNAYKHNVKPALIPTIIAKFKKDSTYVDKKMKKEADARATVDALKSEYDKARVECRNPPSSR